MVEVDQILDINIICARFLYLEGLSMHCLQTLAQRVWLIKRKKQLNYFDFTILSFGFFLMMHSWGGKKKKTFLIEKIICYTSKYMLTLAVFGALFCIMYAAFLKDLNAEGEESLNNA